MSWFEFIIQMSQAWAWPTVTAGALVFLRKPIKLAATGIVARVDDIRRLKGPGFDLEFEKDVKELAETTSEQKSLPTATAHEARLPPESTDEKFAKYQQLLAVEPRAAVLASYADLESLVRQEFERHFPGQRGFVSMSKMLRLLANEGFILGDVVMTLYQLNDLRNRASHEATYVDAETADYYVRTVRNVLAELQSQNFFQDTPATPQSGVSGIPPIEPPPSSPPLRSDGRT